MEKLYTKDTRMYKGYPELRKLGVVGKNTESTPFVWNGVDMRMESCYKEGPTHAVIRERESGKILSTVGENEFFYSFYMENGTAYVLGTKVEEPIKNTIMIYESRDLVNWKGRKLLDNPGWNYFNTSLTKGPEGYVLLIEANQPFEYSGPGPYDFTLFFATSKDMVHWEHMDPNLGFSKERYMGGPWFHYSNGWYYLISVTKLPLKRYTNCIYRTKDFHDWEAGIYNPIMMPSNMDRVISPLAHGLSEEDMQKIATHFNINNSDIDMCDWKDGKTLMVYNTGNQLGEGYLAEAVYDGTMDQYLAACFDE